PKSMENTPLEYFQTAIHWLQARADIKPGSIGVLGISRGGELVLLLGANFPEIHAVVAVSGSSVRWGGVGAGAPFKAIWTWHGKPLPFLSQVKLTGQQTNELKRLFQTNPQAAGFAWCSMQLRDNAAVARARIPVGKINGPVLLISGNDDKLWPSTYMDDMVIRRLADERHPFRDRHLAYPDAGHALYLPNQPTTMNSTVFLTGDRVNFGGNAQGNAAAAADAWPRIIAFLNRILN
ncbi:MAG: acyl-CoA thioester hydrolase/BAAT C-terminal domain-containing protein, partial [Limisphaerales bacterium]